MVEVAQIIIRHVHIQFRSKHTHGQRHISSLSICKAKQYHKSTNEEYRSDLRITVDRA